MKKRQQKIRKQAFFIQKWGSTPDETFVIVGKTLTEGRQWLKKQKDILPNALNSVDKIIEENEKDISLEGNVIAQAFSHGTLTVLHLRECVDNWGYWETLMHEILHLIDSVSKDRCMSEEKEWRAYQFEHLFRSIRRKLQGTDPLT